MPDYLSEKHLQICQEEQIDIFDGISQPDFSIGEIVFVEIPSKRGLAKEDRCVICGIQVGDRSWDYWVMSMNGDAIPQWIHQTSLRSSERKTLEGAIAKPKELSGD